MTTPDAIVVGAGPNGLSAALTLARAGRSVRVYEAQPTIGGATRSAELTEPGFVHDVCSAVHTLVLASPFLSDLPLGDFGLEYVHPELPFAHPLDGGEAAVAHRSVEETGAGLPGGDGRAYRKLMGPFVERAEDLMEALLGPPGPRHPLLMARFGLRGIRSARGLARATFDSDAGRALLAGAAAHAMIPLGSLATAGYGLGLVVSAHAVGWPVARGGSQNLSEAMGAYLRELGGEIVTDHPVESLDALPPARAVLCDVTPRQLIAMAGDRMPSGYRRRLDGYRYGWGVFKMDWALTEPVPWAAEACRRAGTIHIGGTLDEITAAEAEVGEGRVAHRPYAIVVQPSLFDDSRAPAGRHTLWAYCHVPNGSTENMQDRIEAQIERFAPGFKDCILSRSALAPADLERGNANLIGGDIGGGSGDFRQIFARPVLSLNPYRTAMDGVYLCSSSTPPGVGVHGMCGWWAAQKALARELK